MTLSRFLAAACLMAAPPSAAAAPAATAAARLPLSPCHLEGLAEEVRCGRYEVFEDRQARAGRRIGLEVAVLPATRRDAAPDPLVLLAGGPGQGARAMAVLAARAFRKTRRERDIVLVDLRGTGGSGKLDCPRPEDEMAVLDRAVPFDAPECLSALQADVRRYASRDAVDDLDEVLGALGYARVNVWGGSYGTRAALVLAQRHPERLRSAVLDGAAPFEMRMPLFMAADAQAALARLLADCAAEAACRAEYPRLADDLDALLAALARGPARAAIRHPRTGAPTEVAISRETFLPALRAFLYAPEQAALVPLVVTRASRGDWGPFTALLLSVGAWSVETMALGVTLSVLCTEDVPRIEPAEEEPAVAGTVFGASEVRVWKELCRDWPRGAPPDTAAGLPARVPALVLSGGLDPVTPPRWGEAMSRLFTPARHVVVPGAGHNTSFSGCVPDLIADFLARADASRLDTSCVRAIRRPLFELAAGRP